MRYGVWRLAFFGVVTFSLDFNTDLADEDGIEGLSDTKLKASDGDSILHESDVLV